MKPLQAAIFSWYWHKGLTHDLFTDSSDTLFGDLFEQGKKTDAPDIFPFSHFEEEEIVYSFLSKDKSFTCFLSPTVCAIVPDIDQYSWNDFYPKIVESNNCLFEILPLDDEEFHLHLHLQYDNVYNAKDNDNLKGKDFINEKTNLSINSKIEGYEDINIESTTLSWRLEQGKLMSMFDENKFSTKIGIVCFSNIVEPFKSNVEEWANWSHTKIRKFYDSLVIETNS